MFASHLQPNIATEAPKKAPTRVGYGEGLLEAGKRDQNVVALCCDLTESTKTDAFAKEFPKRFIQVGIAEQNLASVGSGMAAMGKIPFIASCHYGHYTWIYTPELDRIIIATNVGKIMEMYGDLETYDTKNVVKVWKASEWLEKEKKAIEFGNF